MSSLTDRLRGIVSGAAPQSAPPAGAIPRVGQERENLEEALGGTWADDRRSFCVERSAPAAALHGRVRVGDIAKRFEAAGEDALSLLTGGVRARGPHLFFDLETTGLSSGAGTSAFLVGAGWFEDDAFVTRQHFLYEYAFERAMLERVSFDLAKAGSLVSFNGKSFDAPVLDTRYLFHRLEWPGAALPHVDALHPARRFWRQAANGPRESCSLIALEEEILGVRRVGDVPGFEIPSRYFSFVRTGDARPLAAVLEHNRLDLLSLAGLAARLLELVARGADAATNAWEALALGRIYANAGQTPRAREAFDRSIEMCRGTTVAAEAPGLEALRALALLHRRSREYDAAAACWRRLLELRSCPPALAREANEALAIHHEHRVRDLAAARMFALQSLESCEGGGKDSGWSDAVRHRLQRIDRKMAPVSARTLFPSSTSSSLLSQPSCGSPRSAPRTSS